MSISMIVAATENNVIARDGQMPWHLPDDLKHFKTTTMGHMVIMGRKNYESMGKALPKRRNVVITRNLEYELPDAEVVHSMEGALALARESGDQEPFIIGGGEIYKMSIDYTHRLYLTRIHTEIPGDVFFPEIKQDNWKVISQKYHPADTRHAYSFTILTLKRK